MSKEADQIYQSFLVRCWLIPAATNAEPSAWRFELRDVSAEFQKHRFSDFVQLKDFVSTKLMCVAARNKRTSDKEGC